MANLSFNERMKLEKILEMSGGYVLEFSNRDFQAFVHDSIGINIYEEKYGYESGSKANLLRGIWKKQSNYHSGKITKDLLDYWKETKNHEYLDYTDEQLYNECKTITERLLADLPVENIDAIQPTTNDRDFSLLAKTIRESIEKNELGAALDRLHTFTVKYTRNLCDIHGLTYEKETPLHSLFGMYVKHIISANQIDSEMTKRILKSSISVLDAFNKVRNTQSFAHDNPILNYHESLLIFNNISNLIHFLNFIESAKEDEKETGKEDNSPLCEDDFPF